MTASTDPVIAALERQEARLEADLAAVRAELREQRERAQDRADAAVVADGLAPVPTTPGQTIAELHAWIATHADGSEGIIGTLEHLPGGQVRMMPLVSSRIRNLEGRRHQAEQAARMSRARGPAEVRAVNLVSYRRIGADPEAAA